MSFLLISCLIGSLSEKSSKKKELKRKSDEAIDHIKKIETFKTSRRTSHNIKLPSRIAKHYPIYFDPLNILIFKPKFADWAEGKMMFVQENQKFYEGFEPKKGFSEENFYRELKSYFPELVRSDNQIGRYYPDIVFFDEKLNVAICIEIDEPCTIDAVIKKHIHSSEHKASGRTLELQKSGWSILRFTDTQILNQSKECCYYIAKVATYLSSDYKYVNAFKGEKLNPLRFVKVFE